MTWHPFQFSLGYWDGDFADSFNLRSNVIPIKRLLKHRMQDPRAIKPSIKKTAMQTVDEAFAAGFYAALQQAGVPEAKRDTIIKQAQAAYGDECHAALVKHAAGFGSAAMRMGRDVGGTLALPAAGAIGGGSVGNMLSGGDATATGIGAMLGAGAGAFGRGVHANRMPHFGLTRGARQAQGLPDTMQARVTDRLQGLTDKFDQFRTNKGVREVGAGMADTAAMGGAGAAVDYGAGELGIDTGGLGTIAGLGLAGGNAARRRLGRMGVTPDERALQNRQLRDAGSLDDYDDMLTRPSNFASGMAQGTMQPGLGGAGRMAAGYPDVPGGGAAQALSRAGQLAPQLAAGGAGASAGAGLLFNQKANEFLKSNGIEPEQLKETATMMQQAGATVDNIAQWAKDTLGPYLEMLGIHLDQYNSMETLALLFGGGMLLATGATALPMMMSNDPGTQGAGMGLGALGALAGGGALAYGNNMLPGLSSR